MVSAFCAKFFVVEEKVSILDLGGRQKYDEELIDYVQRFKDKLWMLRKILRRKLLWKCVYPGC